LRVIRAFLVISFIAVFIATLAECHPFDHYWQVVPDPGPHCRQAYVQLITMGTADIITDILLVIFPLPMVIKSHLQPWTKARLVLLFSLSATLIAITAYRVPSVIAHKSIQQYRTVWASGEILAAAAVSNAIVLGSFLRDRGLKRGKYRPDRHLSASESLSNVPSTRRSTVMQQRLGDDDQIFQDMCYRTEHEDEERAAPRAPPVADGRPTQPTDMSSLRDPQWQVSHSVTRNSEESDDHDPGKPLPPKQSPSRERRVSFFDVGGLLSPDDSHELHPSRTADHSADLPRSRGPDHLQPPQPPRGILRRSTTTTLELLDVGGLLGGTTGEREEKGQARNGGPA
jgi:hypothetical protein